MKIKLYNNNCLDVLKNIQDKEKYIIVTDPPFNINYHYSSYKDKMKEDEYFEFLKEVFNGFDFVCIHYPEALHKLSIKMQKAPIRVVSWVYNSNTPRQHRDIAFYENGGGIKIDFKQVIQPYKNLNDKRIKSRIERGILGGKLYDWWNINQTKNVSKKEINHPCVMPIEVMKNIIGILPKDKIIIDAFMGSGTTGIACNELGRDFVGIEIDENYFNIAKERIEG